MLNIPVAVQDLFKTDGVPKNFRVHFPNGERADITNDMIVNGSVKFTESVCSKDVLQFGLAEASEIQFECVGVENIYGMTIQCAIEIEVGAGVQDDPDIDDTLSWLTPQYVVYSGVKYYRIPYGEFVVESCPRQHGTMKHRRVQGYGKLATDEDIGTEYTLYRMFPYTSLRMTEAFMKCVLDNSQFETNPSRSDAVGYTAKNFFNSSGNKFTITLTNSSLLRYEMYKAVNHIVVQCNAIKANYEANLDYYYNSGVKIAEALTVAGYELNYDSNKKKIYESNEDALRHKMPFLFYPCIMTDRYYSPGKELNYQIGHNVPITPGRLTYVVTANRESITGLYGVSSDGWMFHTYLWFAMNGCSHLIIKKYSNYSSDTVISTDELDVDDIEYSVNVNSVDMYFVQGASEFEIAILPTLSIKNGLQLYDGNNVSKQVPIKDASINGYSYYNSISVQRVLLGFYEIQGKFWKMSRSGDVNAVGLSKSNPIALSKSDYSEMWWDEYSIDSIGSVLYSFGRDNEQYEYVFGDGQSVYDMTDNYLLQHLAIPDSVENPTDYINGLIDDYFVPNVQDVSFVPVDLEARGLPYLEAGDYIVIDDDDGGTVGTYILERSLSGVHSLEDDIQSKGGEIIGSDVRSI